MFQNSKRISSVVGIRLCLLLAQQLSGLHAKPPVTLVLVFGTSLLLSVLQHQRAVLHDFLHLCASNVQQSLALRTRA